MACVDNVLPQAEQDQDENGFRSQESMLITEGKDSAGTNNRFPPAPEACFKQSVVIVENRFEIGMKLEVPDPKAITNTICIATVVDKIGPRLKLKLDGTDDCNIWRLVNDSSLRSIGTCERGGQYLQPPVSFKKNISTWRKFLIYTLIDARVAPETCFISEPKEAQMTFAVGQRLEAVNRKNEALIYPATVVKVTEKELFIHFDGLNSEAYDYWCDRNSRDLFPVGWCRKNNHPLQLISEAGRSGMLTSQLLEVAPAWTAAASPAERAAKLEKAKARRQKKRSKNKAADPETPKKKKAAAATTTTTTTTETAAPLSQEMKAKMEERKVKKMEKKKRQKSLKLAASGGNVKEANIKKLKAKAAPLAAKIDALQEKFSKKISPDTVSGTEEIE